jgi:hypothetical protein
LQPHQTNERTKRTSRRTNERNERNETHQSADPRTAASISRLSSASPKTLRSTFREACVACHRRQTQRQKAASPTILACTPREWPARNETKRNASLFDFGVCRCSKFVTSVPSLPWQTIVFHIYQE